MPEIHCLDFDLLIERSEEGYKARVLDSPAGYAAQGFALPFSELELENFVLRVGQTRRGMRRRESPEMEAAKAFGEQLFNAVFQGEVRGCFRSSLDKAYQQGAGLRIRLRLDAQELTDTPWEYLYNPASERFLCLSVRTPLVRYLDLPGQIQPLKIKPPLRVLAMISSPRDYPSLDVGGEWAKLEQAVEDLEQRGRMLLERLEDATLSALQQRLRRGEYHIFHFIGHGSFDRRAEDGVLLLEDEEGRGRPVSGKYLGTLLQDEPTLRLALLNACEGARTSRADPFAGTAQSLVKQGTPAVIAMQFEITDEAAITFAYKFYGALADGYPVDAALADARKALFAQGNDVEWGAPVLYTRTPDGVLFDLTGAPAPGREADAELERRLERRYIEGLEAFWLEEWDKARELFQAIVDERPDYRDAADRLAEAEQEIAEQRRRPATPEAPGLRPNPYVGPRPFQQGEDLYGRDREVKELLDLLIAERSVLLYSPSGAGKASLIQAALVPALEGEGFRVWPTMRVNLELPPGELSDRSLNRYVLSLLLSLEEALPQDARTPIDELAGMTLDDYLGQYTEDEGEARGDVFVFEQFEEILTLDPTDRDVKLEFFEQLGVMLQNRRRWALFAMREEFIAGLDPYRASIPGRFSATYRLELMNTQAALAAIQEPARRAGVDFTDAAAHILVDDLRRVTVQMPDGTTEQRLSDSVEPVQLQVVCYQLWETLPEGTTQITEADVLAVGDVDSALASYYANQVSAVAAETGVPERAIREWFDQQLITAQGIREQVLMGSEESQGLPNSAIWRLVDADLVRAEKRRGATWFELAHDRLIEPVRADNAARSIEELLASEDHEARLRAITQLGERTDSQAVELLLETLQNSAPPTGFLGRLSGRQRRQNWEMREAIAQALGQLGDPRATAPLCDQLYDPEPGPRRMAAQALGLIGDSDAVAPLIAALGDEDGQVRRQAVQALGEIGDARAAEPLRAALGDEDIGVRSDAAGVLGDIGDARAVEPLIALVRDAAENMAVRGAASTALGQLGDDRAVEPLIAVLQDDGEGAWLRQQAAEALGQLGDRRAVELLITAMALPPEWAYTRMGAVRALGQLGDARAVEPLVTALQNEADDAIREEIVTSLGLLRDDRAVEPLIAALQDQKADIRVAAAEGLGQIGARRARTTLQDAATNDVDPEARAAAERALEQLRSDLSPGSILVGKYEIVEKLEPGELTDKYRARDVNSDQDVRLTVVRDPPDTAEFPERFEQEAATFARLEHPGLVRIYDYGVETRRPYLVREQVGDEHTLRDLLAEPGRLSLEQALPILAQVASAIDYLHAQDPPVLYLHLKPSHVLLQGEGDNIRAVLTDAVTTRAWQASSDDLVATPGYVSPEQASGAPVSPRSDVYGLGLLAYEMLAGRPPFTGDAAALMYAHAEESPRPPQEFAPFLDDAVGAVVLKALAKDPGERYRSAREFMAALKEIRPVEGTGRVTDVELGSVSGPVTIGTISQNIGTIVQRGLSAVEEARQRQEYEAEILAEGVTALAQDLQKRVGEVDAATRKSPYRGLLAYRIDDTEIFFGRDQDIAALLHRLDREPLTILHAESGVGKTSLLQAGLALRLMELGHLPIYVRPFRSSPAKALQEAIVHNLAEAPGLAAKSMRSFLHQVADMLGRRRLLCVFLDQFEEFFIYLEGPTRGKFVTELAECLDDEQLRVRWVISLRSESLGQLAQFRPWIRNPFGNEYYLAPLTRAEAREVVIQPAALQGIDFEPGLVDTMLDELDADGIAPPQIQLVCFRLHQQLRPGETTVTRSLFESLGGSRGILYSYLDDVLSQYPPSERMFVGQLLEALVGADGRRLTRTGQELATELAGLGSDTSSLDIVLAGLVDSRLLREIETDELNGVAFQLTLDYIATQIQLSPSVQARKQAQELLDQEVQTYLRHGSLLSRDRLDVLEPHLEELVVDGDALELLVRSTQKLGVPLWTIPRLADPHDPQTADALLNFLEQNAPARGVRRFVPSRSQDGKIRARETVARKLGELGDARAVEPLIAQLKDPEPGPRRVAAEALSQIGDPRAWAPLEDAATNDPDPEVRAAAERALEQLRSDLSPGSILVGKYEIVEKLEPGELTDKYRARDVNSDQDVRLTVVRDPPDTAEFPERFEQEAATFARLEHPGLVRIYDYGVETRRPYLVREQVGDEHTLRDLLAEPGRLSLEQALPILAQVASAIDYLHAQDPPVLYLHLKPSHVLLQGEGDNIRAVLTDAVTTRAWQATNAALVATPGYVSPEQASGAPVSPRSDVYGLGLLAYEMLAGRPPFTGDAAALMYAHANESPRPPQEFAPVLDDAVGALVLKALAKNPDERYAGAGAFVEALQGAATTPARAVPLTWPPYIYGLHDRGGEHLMLQEDKPGWVLISEAIGADPDAQGGGDYTDLSDQGLGVIVRLNNGHGSAGTIPHSTKYDDFAQRCGNFVAASPGCHIWIIGNEMNLAWERPGGSGGQAITPQLYASCFTKCRNEIRKRPGHEEDQVVVGAVGPWNTETRYPGNEKGDWVQYLADILNLLGQSVDGISLHTYTHGQDPDLAFSNDRMQPPFQKYHWHFRAYRDFMAVIPQGLRDRPVYITETDQYDAWRDEDTGWVRNVYKEIDDWNKKATNQPIQALILYRWIIDNPDDPREVGWAIENKPNVQNEFRDAMANDYQVVLPQIRPRPGSMMDFSAFIAEKTQDFVGREWLFEIIDSWLGTSESRWFWLTGGPGTGKSALAARLVQMSRGEIPSDGYPHLTEGAITFFQFCQAFNDPTLDALRFVQALSLHLAECYEPFALALTELGDRRITINASQAVGTAADGGTVQNVVIQSLHIGNMSARIAFDRVVRRPLERLYTTGYDEPIVILIDALDETLTYKNENIISLLRDVADLPPQVRFLLTSRPDPRLLGMLGQPSLDLIADAPPDKDDVRLYVQERLARSGAAIGTQQLATLAQRISHEAAGNFLYARMVLDDLAQGLPEIPDLSTLPLPAGLGELYRGYLNRELGADEDRWYETFRPTLGLLAVAQAPLNPDQIAAFSQLRLEEIHDSLADLSPYVEQVGGKYRLFHRSFAHFLLDREHSEQYWVDGRRWHASIADYYLAEWGGLEAGLPGLEDPAQRGMHEGYGLRYILTHLLEADRQDDLEVVVVSPGFLSARLSTAAQAALRWAEGFRQKADAEVIYTEYLLAGLYRRERTTAHRLLTLFDDETTIEARLERLVNRQTRTSLRLLDVEPPQALPEPPALSPNTQEALLQSAIVADRQGSEQVRARHVLAGMLAVEESRAGAWIAEILQVERERLHQLLVEAPDAEPFLEQVRRASTRHSPFQKELVITFERNPQDSSIELQIRSSDEVEVQYRSTMPSGAALEELVDRARRELDEAVREEYGGNLDQSTEMLAEQLGRLATLGQRLHLMLLPEQVVLGGTRVRPNLSPGDSILIASLAGQTHLPWELLYERPFETYREGSPRLCPSFLEHGPALEDCPHHDDPKVVCPHGFWGFRYVIIKSPGLTDDYPKPPYDGPPPYPSTHSVPARLSVNFSTRLPLVDPHLEVLHRLASDAGLELLTANSVESVRSNLGSGGKPVGLIYFYVLGGRGEYDEPYVMFGDADRISPDTFNAWSLDFSRSRPLVVLSADGEGDGNEALVSAFWRMGAAAVVGASGPLTGPGPMVFAERLLARVLDGEAVGRAVLAARLELLSTNLNPMGLTYSLYSTSELVLHFAAEELDWLHRLSPSCLDALLWAEGLRQAQELPEVEPMDLLAGLFQTAGGPAERLLTLFDDRQAVVQRLQDRVVLDYSDIDLSDGRLTTSLWSGDTDVSLDEISPPSGVRPQDVPLSPDVRRALAHAYRLAGRHGIREVRPGFLLAALIDDPKNGVADWICELLGVDHSTLVQHTVGTLPAGPDLEALRQASTRMVPTPEGELVPYAIHVMADPATVPTGGGTTITVDLIPFGDGLAVQSLRVPPLETDIVLFLDLPQGFRCVGPDAVSVPLEPTGDAAIRRERQAQRAQFRLLTTGPIPAGEVAIEFLTSLGERLKVPVDLQVEEQKLDLGQLAAQPSPAAPRPVPHPDIILQVLPVPDPMKGNVTFHYLLTQPAAVAEEADVYSSRPVSIHWQAQVGRMLAAAIAGGHRADPEERRARLAALGQELAYQFGPDDLWLALTAGNARTLLILAPDDAWLPWELIHDGYRFLGERLIIARWPAALTNRRPYEFPLGQIHIAHFARVEKPERWSRLMHLRNAPEAQILPHGTLTGEILFTALGGLHILRQGPAPGEAEEPLPVVVQTGDGEAGDQSAGRRDGPDLGRSKLGLRSHRPVVSFGFLDAGVPGLTHLERRWATAYVSAGASAFVGPLWLVPPNVEAAFVRGFYDALWEGRALGEAYHQGQQLAKAAIPTSLDWLAYVLYGDPMARPYRPVEGEGYAVVEAIGRDTDETMEPGSSLRFRLSVRREPPVWHTDRLVEVAGELSYQNLTARMVASELEVTPAGPVPMTKVGQDYLGWVTLEIPGTVADRSIPVEVYFMEGSQMVHMLAFPLVIGGLRGGNT